MKLPAQSNSIPSRFREYLQLLVSGLILLLLIGCKNGDFVGLSEGIPDARVITSGQANFETGGGKGNVQVIAGPRTPGEIFISDSPAFLRLDGPHPIDPAFGQPLLAEIIDQTKIVIVTDKAVLVYSTEDARVAGLPPPTVITPPGLVTDVTLDGHGNVYYTATVTTTSSSTGVFFVKRNDDGTYQPPVEVPTAAGADPMRVAVAEPDATGKGMLATVNNGDSTVTVCERASDGTPENCTSMSTGATPTDVVLDDLNGDGMTDLGVISQNSNGPAGNLAVFLGDGKGGFSAPANYSTGSGPVNVISGLLGDPRPSLVVANETDNTFSVYRNNGDGTFQAKQDYPAGLAPFQLQIADLNHDGNPDINVTSANGQFLSPGNGDGTFPRPLVTPVGHPPVAVAQADLDGDGNLDVVASNADGTITILPGLGNGLYGTPTNITLGGTPGRAAIADFNGDGIPDLAVPLGFNGAVVLLGQGNFNYAPPMPVINLGSRSFSNFVALAAADFNGDGKMDLVIADLGVFQDSVFLGKGDGTFTANGSYTGGGLPKQVITADFNGDGKSDFAVAEAKGTVSVFLNKADGSGTFLPAVTYPVGTNTFLNPSAVDLASGDLTGKGNQDIVALLGNRSNLSTFSVLPNNGNGTFQTAVDYNASGVLPPGAGEIAGNSVVIADIDGDSKNDVVVGNSIFPFGSPAPVHGLVSIVPGKGDGTFSPSFDLASGTGSTGLAIGDFNKDGGMDVATANTGNNTISTFLSPPVIFFSQNPVDFGQQTVGQSATQTLFVANTAAVPIKKKTPVFITVSGAGFSETDDCPDTIPVGGFCTAHIGFTATAPGTSTGALTFTNNATNGIPQVIQLSGIGVGGTSDTTPPTTSVKITPSPNSSGWNNTGVMVTLGAQDNTGGTGVKSITYSSAGAQTIASTTVNSSSAVFSNDAEGLSTISVFATDVAGNSSSPQTFMVKIDKTAPSILGASMPAANSAGWNNKPVTVSFQCSDTLSGLAPGSPPAPTVLSTEGLGQMVSGSCTDIAGNTASAQVKNLNLDFTPPVLTISANPPANANNWNNTAVVVSFSAVDNLSGVAEVSAPVTVSGEGRNQMVSGNALDVAGNLTTGSLAISIDLTPPEAFNQFDPASRDAALFGRDSLSGTAPGPLQPLSVTQLKAGSDADDLGVPNGDGIVRELRTYQVLDLAGNQLLLTEKVRRNHQREAVRLLTLQYAQGPIITLGPNRQVYDWKLNSDGSLRSLEQNYRVGDGPSEMQVEARFSARDNQTVIEQHGPDQKTVKPGLALLRLATSKGALSIELP